VEQKTLVAPRGFEAEMIRAVLRRHLSRGVWFTERRAWWFWVKFSISGPADALRAALAAVEKAEGEDWEKFIW
jgi:hypothetical protein